MTGRPKKIRRRFAWRAFFKKFRINERMSADFVGVERRTIARWRRRGSVPVEHFARLQTMTERKAKELRAWQWVRCDLALLQKRLGCNQEALAKKLGTSGPNVKNWKTQHRIPRAYLEKIRALRKTLR